MARLSLALVFLCSRPPVPFVVRGFGVWVWGGGSIARVTRLWLFLFQSLRPLVGLVSWFQRYQIINLSYLGLTVLLKTTCPMGGG